MIGMPGLPRAADKTRPRDAYQMMVLDPIERTTTALRRGDAISAQSVAEIDALIRRVEALKLALEDRLQILETE